MSSSAERDQPPVDDCCRRRRAGDEQRPDRRFCRRGTRRLGPRDRPAGASATSIAGEADRPGQQHRRGGARSCRQRPAHRPGRQPDHRHRRADQPARPQCHHRGGPRRRGRQGIRRGRDGGEDARRADVEGDRRNLLRRSRRCRPRPTRWSRRSRPSPARSSASTRFPRRSPPRSRSRARHRRDRPERSAGGARHAGGLEPISSASEMPPTRPAASRPRSCMRRPTSTSRPTICGRKSTLHRPRPRGLINETRPPAGPSHGRRREG